MGLRFRKSINLGPFRMTVSKSGVSTSFGVKGARITKTANGRIRKTVSIPGTGISHVEETSASKNLYSNKGEPWFSLVVGALVLAVMLSAFSRYLGKKDAQPVQETVKQEETVAPPKLEDEQKKLFMDAVDGLLEDGVVNVLAYNAASNIEVIVKSAQLDAAVEAASGAAPDGWSELESAAAEASVELLSQAQNVGFERSYLQLVSNADGEIYTTCFNGKVSYDKFAEKADSVQVHANDEITVWVSKSGSKYHFDSNCGGHEYTPTAKSAAIAKGLSACKKCAKYG